MAKTRYHGGSSLPASLRFKNTGLTPPKPAAPKTEAPLPTPTLPFPPGVVAFSSGQERCGVNEYSRDLSQAMRLAGSVVTDAKLSDVALLGSAPAGAEVLVHAEPSLLRQDLYPALAAAHRRGAKVVVVFHHCDAVFFESFTRIADVLVVHRDYGIRHPRLRRVPLACPVYTLQDREALRRKFGFDRLVITTFGFASAWKRFPELAEALLPEMARRDAVFQMLCPAHYSGDPSGEARKLEVLAEQWPGTCVWVRNFLPEGEVLDRVRASDLGVMYHAHNTGSCSAASKVFVSARVPLLVTGSNHDSDILGAERIRGFEMRVFAHRALELLDDRRRRAELVRGMEDDYARMNMAVVARQYQGLFEEVKR
jgi:hypothetical protein